VHWDKYDTFFAVVVFSLIVALIFSAHNRIEEHLNSSQEKQFQIELLKEQNKLLNENIKLLKIQIKIMEEKVNESKNKLCE
jgi:hypothetical protein